jgi:Tfp pilus assembly protein PilO
MNSTTTRLGVIAGGAALFLVIIWFFALFQPESHHLKAAHAAKAAADAKAQSLDAQVVTLKALEKQAPQDRAALAMLKQSVPDNADLSDALGQLHNAATVSGVELSSLSPTPPTASSSASQQSSGPTPIQLTMSATGTYQQMVTFMTLLDKMSRVVVLNSVNLSSTGGQLAASLSAQLFYAGSSTP